MSIERNMKYIPFVLLLLFQNTVTSQKLKVGEKAPNFEAVDTNGEIIKLSSYKGQKVFIAFFRYAGCPVCNFRIHELIENYDSIRSKGYKIIAIYESNNDTLREYIKETPIPFTVIGNPNLRLYKEYRVEKSFWKMLGSAFKKQPKEAMKKGNKQFSKKYKRDGHLNRIPADFLIDEKGLLTTVHYGKNIGDHLPLSEILKN
ncbi:putative peroxiredoxin bcp [compost metagenome]